MDSTDRKINPRLPARRIMECPLGVLCSPGAASHNGAYTLNRATRAVVDLSAKSLLFGRIVLEAKRLLAHSAS
jgi:hypothetical protein